MNIEQVNKMDERIIGPRLFCEICSKSKVFSPCYSCQYSQSEYKAQYCRGCGKIFHLKREFTICKMSDIDKGFKEIEIEEDKNIIAISFVDIYMLDEMVMKKVEKIMMDHPQKDWVIDFSGINYLLSGFESRFVLIYKQMRKQKRKITLCSLQNNILQWFKVTKFDKIVPIYKEKTQAIQSLQLT